MGDDVEIVVRARTKKGKLAARLLASEIAAAVESISVGSVTLEGPEWPAHDGNGRDACVERHEDLMRASESFPSICVRLGR